MCREDCDSGCPSPTEMTAYLTPHAAIEQRREVRFSWCVAFQSLWKSQTKTQKRHAAPLVFIFLQPGTKFPPEIWFCST
jgi:hypothetical protein